MPPSDNFRSGPALTRFLLTAIVGLGLDLWTKAYAFSALGEFQNGRLVDSRVYPLIPGWLHFEVTTNIGAVFGLGQGHRLLFLSVSIIAIGFLFWLFAKSDNRRWQQVFLGMLLAGVMGNMYDRVIYGYVRDMVHILPAWGVFPWIFNVADVLLCTGVALMVLSSLFEPMREKTPDA